MEEIEILHTRIMALEMIVHKLLTNAGLSEEEARDWHKTAAETEEFDAQKHLARAIKVVDRLDQELKIQA